MACKRLFLLLSLLLFLFGNTTGQQCLENPFIKSCPGLSDNTPAVCCFEIFRCNSLSPSGYYWIRTNGTVQATHCEMDLVKITSTTPGSSEDYPAGSCFDVYECNPYAKSDSYWIKSSRSRSSKPNEVYCNRANYNITEIISCPRIQQKQCWYLSYQQLQDCKDVYERGYVVSGVYTIKSEDSKKYVDPGCGETMEVYCDMDTPGGPWTMFQRRQDGSVDFYRSWVEFEEGFGDPSGEFWLGLKSISCLTKPSRRCQLRIDMTDFNNISRYAIYNYFTVENATSNYILRIANYSGDAGDSMLNVKHTNNKSNTASGMQFSTFDSYNDRNCAVTFCSGWWHNDCFHANLNGVYRHPGEIFQLGKGIHWRSFTGYSTSLQYADMKLMCY